MSPVISSWSAPQTLANPAIRAPNDQSPPVGADGPCLDRDGLRNPTIWRRPRRLETGLEIWVWMARPPNILIGTTTRVAALIARFVAKFSEDHVSRARPSPRPRTVPRIPVHRNTR